MSNRKYREVMSKFASGVTIVTTQYNGEILGMTVSAFMCISLEPNLIAISIDEKNEMYDILQKNKKFGVSILKAEQENISKVFANQIEKEQEINFIIQDGVPVVDGTLAQLSCNVKQAVKAGDHMIFIAEVTDLSLDDGDALVYYSRNYHSVNPTK